MSIIEKALDKALGHAEDEVAAEERPVQETHREPVKEEEPVIIQQEPVEEPLQAPPEISEVPPVVEEVLEEGPAFALNWQELRAHGFVDEAARGSDLNLSYRAIARPVLINAFPSGSAGIQRGNLVLVTSSRFGEGKTYTAINLALSIAMDEPARKVLLVDADTAKASLTKLFGLTGRAGFTDLLESKGPRLQDAVLRTDLHGLRILPAGSVKHDSHGLLAGAAVMKFAKDLSKSQADQLVIFDAPPLLDVEETASLAMQLGQILLVVEAEMTPQVVVREAAAKLEFCNVVGCVLNKASERTASGTLSFGYGVYHPEEVDS